MELIAVNVVVGALAAGVALRAPRHAGWIALLGVLGAGVAPTVAILAVLGALLPVLLLQVVLAPSGQRRGLLLALLACLLPGGIVLGLWPDSGVPAWEVGCALLSGAVLAVACVPARRVQSSRGDDATAADSVLRSSQAAGPTLSTTNSTAGTAASCHKPSLV